MANLPSNTFRMNGRSLSGSPWTVRRKTIISLTSLPVMAYSLPKLLWRLRFWMPMTTTLYAKRYSQLALPQCCNFSILFQFCVPAISHYSYTSCYSLYFSIFLLFTPSISQSLYSESVPEDSPAGRLILQVSATDADIRSNAQISYELQGVGSELFIIDSDTGVYLCGDRNVCKGFCV